MRAVRMLLIALIPALASLAMPETTWARGAHKGSHVAAKKNGPAKAHKKTAGRAAHRNRRSVAKKIEPKAGHRHKTAARGRPRRGAG